MIFKHRKEAAEKLSEMLKKELKKQEIDNAVIVSLLRGGFIIGKIISEKLHLPHLPLASVKIPSLENAEYALGALCFNKIFTPRYADRTLIEKSLHVAEEKFELYRQKFNLSEDAYQQVKGKVVIVVDDGIATGSTAEAAALFLRQFQPKKLILAVPVSPVEFSSQNYDEEIILHKEPNFYSVSQFYEEFPQVEIEKI